MTKHLSWLVAACLAATAAWAAPAPIIPAEVVTHHPHDTGSFTQGLTFPGGRLYESTGGYGSSRLMEVDRWTGQALRRTALDRQLFGEGLAAAGDTLYQLTWKAGHVLTYDMRLRRTGQLQYRGQGWGLTFDGRQFIRSNGSAELIWHAADDFSVIRRLTVRDDGKPVRQLNELEWVDGLIYANVWYSPRVAIIQPDTGTVHAWLDLAGLDTGNAPNKDNVLNGIAWEPGSEVLWVTGKRWGRMYEIRRPDLPSSPAPLPQERGD